MDTLEEAGRARVRESYGQLPLSFEANQGQTDARVKFLSRGSGYSLFLTANEAVLALNGPARRDEGNDGRAADRSSEGRRDKRRRAVLRMKLEGTNPSPRVAGVEELPGRSNYFIGDDPAKWRTGVAGYSRVQYRDVYPGVNLVYYGNQRQLEYDFVVAPGADPRAIGLRFYGAERMRLDKQGDLILETAAGEVRQRRPFVYQETEGGRREVAGRYVMKGRRTVGFEVADYDAGKPLVIDPVLVYSTYLGGSGSDDQGQAIAVDAAGNAYITGRANSTDFPTQNPAQPAYNGGYDVFITKLNAAGNALVYSTYLGGTDPNLEEGLAVSVDAAGNAYVTGYTRSFDFPTQNPFQPAKSTLTDAFVTKLSATGNALVYSTYLGGSSLGNEEGRDIAVDAAGNAYVAGLTRSTDFPTQNPLQSTNSGGHDVFVTKVNAAGTALVYSTYVGGGDNDFGNAIAVDAAGNAYVTGLTVSTDFPTQNPFQPAYNGLSDAFVTKVNAAGTALVYSTYLGGANVEEGRGVAVDASGSAYLTGYTASTDFPTQNPLQPARIGFNDVFVTKLNPAGNALIYSTYLGGSGVSDLGNGIEVDQVGSAYVTGLTASTDFPTQDPFQLVNNGGGDAFVSKLNPAGTTLAYSTYLGGGSNDEGRGIAVDAAGNLYVTGVTGSTNFPTRNPFQVANNASNGGNNAFIAKIFTGLIYTVGNTNDSGPGSFRQAILNANANQGLDQIEFNIPGAGVQTIAPTSPLPAITDSVVIDGTTQPGYAGTPVIEIAGSSAGAGHGLQVNAGGSTIKGLVINRFSGTAVHIQTGGGNTIQGNYIGTNAAGTAALGNGGHGVLVDNTPNNLIGGAAAGARNVISGNTLNGVEIVGANAAGNVVAGNYIGTNAAGTAGLSGSGTGVRIGHGANNNTVGGTSAAARNVISGNNGHGVGLGSNDNSVSANNTVQGNYIGLMASGAALLPNGFSGVILAGTGATNNLIGGTSAGAGNVIAGNGHQAVAIVEGPSGNTVQGNFMGTDATGNVGLGGEGVFIGGGSSNNLIGGTTAAARNVISGNTGAAVSINDFNGGGATGNRVEGNFIGVNPAGAAAVPNGAGVVINNVSGNAVGGLAAGTGNVIANNTGSGVHIDTGTGNAVLSNSIFNNGNPGIGLVNGGNNNQAAPALTSAVLNAGTTTITGTLTSAPNALYVLQFFANPACDPSGSGEGQIFLGTDTVTTNGSGVAPISSQITGAAAGQVITATATATSPGTFNNTSRFSQCRPVTGQTVTISGRVTNNGVGVPGVTVTVSGGGTQALQTDAAGNYSFNVPAGGSYTVLPTSPYFVFAPLRADFPNVSTNVTADFAVVPAATPTPTPPLQDDFDGAQRDPEKWNLGTLTQPAEAFDPQVTVSQQSGQLRITPRDNAPAASYNGYVSVKAFDFTGGRVSVEAAQAAGGGAETAFSLGSDTQNNYRFSVMPVSAAPQSVKDQLAKQLGGWRRLTADMLVLVFQVRIAGVVTQQVIPYDPVQHRFWRFRHEPPASSILFETSGDNVAYTERFRRALDKSVSALAVELTAGTAAPATGTTDAVFDNLSLVSANVQFATDVLSAGEGDGRIQVTVTRSGNVAGSPATLVYRTEDSDTFTVGCADAAGARGGAYARCDFATTVGTLSFASGETSKSFTVPVIDDGHAEGAETFDLKLVSASGAALGAPGLIRVTIRDNDAPGSPNPVLGPPHAFFVRQQYLDFLSREPDDGGFNAWLGVLNNCPNANTGPEVESGCDRIFVSGEGFFRSVEFQLKGAYVFRFYKVAFNRLPEYTEIVSDMSFVAGATQQEVFARRAQLATQFTERQEFKALYGGMTNAQYVAALLGRYQLTSVTAPDPAQPDGAAKVTLSSAELTARLASGTLSRDQVLRAVADSDEVGRAEFDNAFVAVQYYGYLRRKPEPSGFEAWLRVLRSGDTRTMVNGFLNSAEYKLRFGQP